MKSSATVIVAACFLSVFINGLGAQGALHEGWYSSDPAGLALDSIPNPAGYEYALRVLKQNGTVRSELFQNGKTARVWIKAYGPSGLLSRETMEKEGLLKEEFLYDAEGRPNLERIFLDSGDVEETAYEYASGRLVSRTTSIGGTSVLKMTYLYAPDGRLALAREASGNDFGTSEARTGSSASWSIGTDGLELRTYDTKGRLVSISLYDGAERLNHEERFWKEGTLERVDVEAKNGSMTSTDYIMSGAATGEVAALTAKRNDKVVSTERRTYDETGRLSRVDASLGGRDSVVEYDYDDDGVLASTRTSVEGILSSIIRYESQTVRVEELYDAGAVFARVRYEDGRRVLEEMLRDGIVVRTRRFP
ncbi:MAG: hypothetical protein A2Y38_20470 [Spirochaetes bacterium GWB1_59_5]|nr:MAG: hypothetical protein A2Y38_20470 [Spirochaetes bacterium GWB1_59_5]